MEPEKQSTSSPFPEPTSDHGHDADTPKGFFARLDERIRIKDSTALSNVDLAPSPPDRWTWSTWSYFAYWWSESFAVSTWALGASAVAVGLSVRDSLLIVLFANIISAAFVTLNGFAAAKYRVGFPVLARSIWGVRLHYFVVVIRGILGIIWGGVQMYFQGQFISIMLSCLIPGFFHLRNTLPASAHITTQDLVGFVLAFLVTLPFMLVPTWKIYPLFQVKAFVMPLAGMAIVIWVTAANGGVSAGIVEETSLRGSTSTYAWGVLSQMNSIFGANSALLVTVPDLARHAKTSRSQAIGQLLGLPVAQTLCAGFGVIATAAVKEMWGTAYWNPYALLEGILTHSYTSGARAGVFFAAFAWAFAALGTTIADNIVPFAADATCLLPRYISVIRGQFICVIVAFAITPWHVVATSNGFLSFLGGYSIFQGSVVSIAIVDYFLLRRQKLDITDLYNSKSTGRYFFFHGCNLRAAAAFVVGFALPLPGLVRAINGSALKSISPADHLFAIGWLLSVFVGGCVYYLLGLIFPKAFESDRYSYSADAEGASSSTITPDEEKAAMDL